MIGDMSSSEAVTSHVTCMTRSAETSDKMTNPYIIWIPCNSTHAPPPSTAILLPTVPPRVLHRATTSHFPRRSYTTEYLKLLAPVRTSCTCWFQAIDVISSSCELRLRDVGEQGFEGSLIPHVNLLCVQARGQMKLRESDMMTLT